MAQLKGHTNWVTSLTFRHNGMQLVSASFDMSIILWTKLESVTCEDRERWLMTYRFGSGFSLIADHAYLKDAKLSSINRKILEECGAKMDKTPPQIHSHE